LKNGVKIISFGDFLLEDKFVHSYEYKKFIKLFNEYDIVTFNLETTVSDLAGKKQDKSFNFKTGLKNLCTLKSDVSAKLVCNIANNHIMDYGEECLNDTIKNLKENSILYTGYSKNLKIKEGITFIDVNNKRLAFIGAFNGFNVTLDKSGLTPINDSIYDKVKYAKKNADYVVVHLHWGEELSLSQTPKQVKIAHKLVDFGADIILGHHPHVIQANEIYKNSLIIYSMGNFQLRADEHDKNTRYANMFEIEIYNQDINYNVIPIYIDDNIPTILNENDKEKYGRYKYIEKYNKYYLKKNSWMLFYCNASRKFFKDSLNSWDIRKRKGEKNLKYKKVRWFISKHTLIMSFFFLISILFNIKEKEYEIE